jgi:hypothetical protein
MKKEDDLKKKIKEKKVDRRELAKKIGITPNYLNQMLGGWAPLKEEYRAAITQELDTRISTRLLRGQPQG